MYCLCWYAAGWEWLRNNNFANQNMLLVGLAHKANTNTKSGIKNNSRKVSALLMVKVQGQDTTYKLMYRQHYLDYGFEEKAGNWNARKVFLLFAMAEEQLFDTKSFIVNDGRIMGGKIGERFRISFEAPATSSDPNNQLGGLVTTCKNYRSCFTVGGPMICNSRTICKTDYIHDDGPGEWQNLPPDEGAGGGEMTDKGIVDVDPCPVTRSSEQITWLNPDGTVYILDPCDENAWGPESIENNVKNPCLRNMVDAAIDKNIKHEIVDFIYNTFGKDEGMDLIFEDGVLNPNEAAFTRPEGTPSEILKFRIRLNVDKLTHSSKEYIAATIFHEILHAWITLNQGNPSESISHEMMAQQNNLMRMTGIILKMYPTLSDLPKVFLQIS